MTIRSEITHAGPVTIRSVRYHEGMKESFPKVQFAKEADDSMPTLDTQGTASCQTIRGYGFGLTESTVINFQRLKKTDQKKVLNELFSREKGAGLNYLVLPLSSTDFNDPSRGDFSVCDCKDGEPSVDGSCFNPQRLEDSIQMLQRAREINPELKVGLKPWTTPPYMKKKESLEGRSNPYLGGDFDGKWSKSLASCLAKATDWVIKKGIPVQSLAVQNEPGLKLDYPSVYMDNDSHAQVLDELHRQLEKSHPEVQLVLRSDNFISAYDAKSTFEKMETKPRGMAFLAHCYSNDPETSLHLLPEGKKSFCAEDQFEYGMGECSASNLPSDGDFGWWMNNRVMLDTSMGANVILAWNGILDEKFGPQNFGCAKCRGLITTDFTDPHRPQITVNPEMQAISMIAKITRPGSKRLVLPSPEGMPQSHIFVNPDGSHSGIFWNDSNDPKKFQLLTDDCRRIVVEVPSYGAVSVQW